MGLLFSLRNLFAIILYMSPRNSLRIARFAQRLTTSNSGLWIVFPSYNIYILGQEILSALETATPRARHGRTKSA